MEFVNNLKHVGSAQRNIHNVLSENTHSARVRFKVHRRSTYANMIDEVI